MPISLTDFKKVELTVGKILSAEKVPETDKLLKLSVDFGSNTNYEHIRSAEISISSPEAPQQDTKVRTATTPALADSGTPFAKGDITTPSPSLEKDGRRQGQKDIRQIVSGIATHFPDPQTLVGKKCLFVTNITPRMIKGLESNGMILALSTDDGKFSLLEPNEEILEGTRAK